MKHYRVTILIVGQSNELRRWGITGIFKNWIFEKKKLSTDNFWLFNWKKSVKKTYNLYFTQLTFFMIKEAESISCAKIQLCKCLAAVTHFCATLLDAI